MLLSQLSAGAAPIEISSLAYDSRTVTPGALFFCVRGVRSDGHDHAGGDRRDRERDHRVSFAHAAHRLNRLTCRSRSSGVCRASVRSLSASPRACQPSLRPS